MLLTGLPLPPSVNELYTNISMQGRPGRVKSKAYVEYCRAMDDWAWANMAQLRPLRAWVQTLHPNDLIRVDCLFLHDKKSILCANGKPKKNDTSNRLKAALDLVAGLLHIDDCRFWAGGFDKAVGPEGMVLKMGRHTLTTLEEFTSN
jgi:hypothetical protein